MRQFFVLLVACAAAKQCCNGKPCGNTCISMKKKCTVLTTGSATCRLGKGCGCESIAHEAWEAWKGSRDFKAALQPLVGHDDDPWMMVLYKCFSGGFKMYECLSSIKDKIEL